MLTKAESKRRWRAKKTPAYLAKQRTEMFGFPWEVDHVIPLAGETVSGLHVPWNLQVVPRSVNRNKSNRLLEI